KILTNSLNSFWFIPLKLSSRARNKLIVEMTKSAIMNPSTGIYTITLLYIPMANQYGPQGAESVPITDPNDIWNQSLSSTTITPPTIHTPLRTTIPIPNLPTTCNVL
ncbi:unnamed protein product, partial [Rotaria sp. Silwood1]